MRSISLKRSNAATSIILDWVSQERKGLNFQFGFSTITDKRMKLWTLEGVQVI